MYIQAYSHSITMQYELSMLPQTSFPQLCDVNGIHMIAIDVHVVSTNCHDPVPCPIAFVYYT